MSGDLLTVIDAFVATLSLSSGQTAVLDTITAPFDLTLCVTAVAGVRVVIITLLGRNSISPLNFPVTASGVFVTALRVTAITGNQIAVIAFFHSGNEDSVSADNLDGTEHGASVSIYPVPVIALFRKLADSVTATDRRSFKRTERRAAVAGQVIAIIALFKTFNESIAASGRNSQNGTDIRAPASRRAVEAAKIAFFAGVRLRITAFRRLNFKLAGG